MLRHSRRRHHRHGNLAEHLALPCIVVFAALAWLGAAPTSPWTGTLALLLVSPGLLVGLVTSPLRQGRKGSIRKGLSQLALRWLTALDGAISAADAYRAALQSLATGRHRLDWNAAGRSNDRRLGRPVAAMGLSAATALLLAFAIFAGDSTEAMAASALPLLAWIVAPAICWRLGWGGR